MALLNDLPVDRRVPEDEAFDAIYREFKPALVSFCRARLSDASEAEDAAQEALLRAYRSLPRFDRTQRMWPWLATIAANVCTDMRRKKQAVPLSSLRTDPRGGTTIDLTEDLDRRAKRHLVAAALDELPAGQRRELYLADAEGWSYADIARLEQRTVPSVRTSLMRGRSAFKARARAMAEDRGMWPLAALPVVRLRRLLPRLTRSSGATTSAAPVAIGALQVAAVALVVIGSIVPVAGTFSRAGASVLGDPLRPAQPSAVVADRVDHDAPSAAPPPAAQLPVAPPATTATGVDVDDDGVAVQASADLGADPDDDPTVLGVVHLNCRDGHRSQACELVGGLTPS